MSRMMICEECHGEFSGYHQNRRICATCVFLRQKRFAEERRLGIRKSRPRTRTPDERWATLAGRFVALAKQLGALPPLGDASIRCVDCGAVATEYDHRDYAKPLEVEPVCRGCNALRGSAKAPTIAAPKRKVA